MSSGRPRATGLNGRVVVIALNAGCTVAMYPGPKRPPTETAQIAASGESSVRNIDGTDLPVAPRFTVLPGLHTISAGSGALPGGAWLWTPL